MDTFLDRYWNQIVGWAETRDPEIVRAAAIPKELRPRKSVNLLAHCPQSELRVLGVDRDVEGELWAASGMKPNVRKFVSSSGVREMAEQTGRPVYEVSSDTDLSIMRPVSQAANAFLRDWMCASSSDRAKTIELFSVYADDKTRILSDPRLTELASDLVHSIRTYIFDPEAQGPPHVVAREHFPTV